MIKSKTGIRFLRHLGFALIALPEPVTTPFGIVLLLVSRYLARRVEARVNKQLQNTLKNYLIHFNRFSDDAEGQSNFPDKARRFTQRKDSLTAWQYHWGGKAKAADGPQRRDLPDDIKHHTVDMTALYRRFGAGDEDDWLNITDGVEDVIHHTVNMERLRRRFGNEDGSNAEPDWLNTSNSADDVVHHTVDMERLSRRFGGVDSADSNRAHISGRVWRHSLNMNLLDQRQDMESVAPAKVKRHFVDMAALMRRFGPDADSISTLKAR